MADAIFPSFINQAAPEPDSRALPLLRECKWDFENDRPVFAGGEPVIVTGKEAVLVWAWNALHTARSRYEMYTQDYGSDVENLIGTSWSSELKTAEARQYVEECLLASPYILALRDMELKFEKDVLTIQCRIESIYGVIQMEVG
ncbi:MAG: DUF2634 domain-containing protein [Clostridiaceae bacterium]|jgi:hypothetical protein|nr:DUF2634 domain-containing protein [Clostridiaceae bacterium]